MQQFALYSAPGGALLGDYSNRAQGFVVATNARGFAEARGFIPMGPAEAFQFYDRAGLPHAMFNDQASGAIYEGRVEDVAIVAGGVQIQAFGYSRAFDDLPYTNMWSTAGFGWRPLQFAENGNCTPESYAFNVNGGYLSISPLSNSYFGTFAGTPAVCAL